VHLSVTRLDLYSTSKTKKDKRAAL